MFNIQLKYFFFFDVIKTHLGRSLLGAQPYLWPPRRVFFFLNKLLLVVGEGLSSKPEA